MAKQNYGGVYANMEFPPYVWTEYPKHVPIGGGRYEVANNADDEAKILQRLQKDEDNAPAYIEPLVTDPAKEILISRARELGVPFNAKWSKTKLEQVVKEAEDTIDSLPAESNKSEDTELPSEELKEKLLAEAKALGIPANRLWGIPRLRASIAEFTKATK